MKYNGHIVDVVNTNGKWFAVVSKDGKTVYSSGSGYYSRGYAFADGIQQVADLSER